MPNYNYYATLVFVLITSLLNAQIPDSYELELDRIQREQQFIDAPYKISPIELVPSEPSLYSLVYEGNWAYDFVGMEEHEAEVVGRAKASGGKAVCIIIDTGVPTHPALQFSMLDEYNRTFNGDILDDVGHSTHVGGIIVADNPTKNVGILHELANRDIVKVIYVKVLNSGYGNYNQVAQGFEYALSIVPKLQAEGYNVVVNASLGGGGSDQRTTTAINKLWDTGAVVLTIAAGNDNGPVSFPGKVERATAIAAIDGEGNRASFSNYGTELDLCAPGVNIYSTYRNGWAELSGTSMAAPVEASMVLLAWVLYPDATNNQIVRLMLATARDLGPEGRDDYYGQGYNHVYDILVNDPYGLPDDPVDDPEPPETPVKRNREVSFSMPFDFNWRWKPLNSVGNNFEETKINFTISLKTNLYAEQAYDEILAVINDYFKRTYLVSRIDDDFTDASYWAKHFLNNYLKRLGYDVSFENFTGEDGQGRITVVDRYSAFGAFVKLLSNPEIQTFNIQP